MDLILIANGTSRHGCTPNLPILGQISDLEPCLYRICVLQCLLAVLVAVVIFRLRAPAIRPTSGDATRRSEQLRTVELRVGVVRCVAL